MVEYMSAPINIVLKSDRVYLTKCNEAIDSIFGLWQGLGSCFYPGCSNWWILGSCHCM